MSTTVTALQVERKVVISNRLTYALTTEDVQNKRVCELFNIPLPYISSMKNQALFNKVPEKVWRRFNRWEESGDTLVEYAKENRLMDGPTLVSKTEAPKPVNGEVRKPIVDKTTKPPKKEEEKLVNLRVNGMSPTTDMELIQTRIDSLVKALDMKDTDKSDTIKAVVYHIEVLKKQGFTVHFTIEMI